MLHMLKHGHFEDIYQQNEYILKDDMEQLVVPLRWTNPDGIVIEKRFVLTRGSYEINVEYEFVNQTTTTINSTFFGQIKRDRVVESINAGGGIGIQAYLGSAYSTEEKRYERYDFDDMDDGRAGGQSFLYTWLHCELCMWVVDFLN